MGLADSDSNRPSASNFIRDIIESDLKTGTTDGRVMTRFPPEPNGYLHIGHAKSICLNFGLAIDYHGVCNLRFDDTNPVTEEEEFVRSIKNDVRWLGFDWGDNLFFASDYFEELYRRAELLISKELAYVDSLDEEAIRAYRGTVTEAGRESPYRIRSVEKNLDLFRRMRAGEFADGSHVLRAKIDMASPNMLMRDPVLYRIKHAHHHRTGDEWCIYPMYDYAHPLSDAIEGITHSICTLEFEVHRPLYDWVVENAWEPPLPHQYEFARLNLDYTVMSKRKLLQLVNEGHVSGWDDPRMATISGLRRRGYTPASIRLFADMVGVAKADNRIDMGLLEYCIRTDLNPVAPRVMCVLSPLRVVLTNYPEDRTEELDAPYFPHDIGKEGSRKVPFTRELYIEKNDFSEDPPKGFFRLSPGAEVRLRYAYIIRCDEVITDNDGNVVELRCTYDPATRSGAPDGGRKVKGTIHWVSARHALRTEVRLYDRLFSAANPDAGPEDFKAYLNPNSIEIIEDARIEPAVADDDPDTRYQFTRLGYFTRDAKDSTTAHPVFNRIVTLRDTWARKVQKAAASEEEAPSKPGAPRDEPVAAGPSTSERIAGLSSRRRERFDQLAQRYGLNDHDALVLAENRDLAAFFAGALEGNEDARTVASWVVNELPAAARGKNPADPGFEAVKLGRLVALIQNATISSRTAKDVLAEMVRTGDDPEAIVEREGLVQVSDRDTLAPIVDELLAANPEKAQAYRSGKTGLLGFFVGEVMRQTGGKADPKLVQSLLKEQLGE